MNVLSEPIGLNVRFVADSVHNQDRLLTCGGMEALISALHRCVNRLRDDEAFREPALNITIAIDAVVTGNGKSICYIVRQNQRVNFKYFF